MFSSELKQFICSFAMPLQVSTEMYQAQKFLVCAHPLVLYYFMTYRKRMLEYQPRRQSSRLEKLKQQKEEEEKMLQREEEERLRQEREKKERQDSCIECIVKHLFAGRPCQLQLGEAVKYLFLVNVDQLSNFFLYIFLIRVVKSRMSWVRHVSCMGQMKSAYRILVGRPEGKSLLERHRRRGQDNIVTCQRLDVGFGLIIGFREHL